MALDRTRRRPIASIDLGNAVAKLSVVEGHLWLSLHGLPTATAPGPHLLDLSLSGNLPRQLRLLAEIIDENTPPQDHPARPDATP